MRIVKPKSYHHVDSVSLLQRPEGMHLEVKRVDAKVAKCKNKVLTSIFKNPPH